jgi:proteasome lid subunit RPN8/RPN11
MQFLYCLFLILPLSAICNSEHPFNREQTTTPIHKIPEYIEKIDPGVQVIQVTKEWAEKMGVLHFYEADSGFTKWIIVFHSIPGSPPYEMQQKRMVQSVSEQYHPCPTPNAEDIQECKNAGEPAVLIVSAKGYLLGEPVTIRLSGKDAQKQVTFYPRPLALKKENGDLLAKARLCDLRLGQTSYDLKVCGVEKQEKYQLTSQSGEESFSHNCEGPLQCNILPGVLGQSGGIASIALQLEDGAFYEMQLPWGLELMDYSLGKK